MYGGSLFHSRETDGQLTIKGRAPAEPHSASNSCRTLSSRPLASSKKKNPDGAGRRGEGIDGAFLVFPVEAEGPRQEGRHLRASDVRSRPESTVRETGGDAGGGESLDFLEGPESRSDIGEGGASGSG